jgi:hypothetical protein
MTRQKQNTFYLTDVMVLFVLCVFNYTCFSKNQPPDLKLKAGVLKTDFTVMRKTLEEAHPGLYWYSSRAAMDKYFDSTYSMIDHDMTSVEFFKLLLPVIANIRCGHSNLGLPSDINNRVQFHNLLPFNFFCRDGKLWITKDFGNTKYESVEILSINSIPTKEIINTLLNTLPADGYNETFKYHLLSVGALREGYALYFGQPDSFIVKAVDPDSGKPFAFTVKAKRPQELLDTKKTTLKTPLLLSFRPDLNTSVLVLNSFEINTKKFKDTLITIFKAIKEQNSKHLIIDLRQNGGGINDNVSTLFSFIASAPFLHLKRAEMNAPVFTYLKHFNNPQSINNFHGVPDASGKYLVNYRYAGTSLKNPEKENLFKGKVVFLTSGNTTSAASEFSAISRFTKRAKIVGEETGGCFYGATGGNFLILKLPNSGLEVRIPTIRIFTAVDEDYIRQPKGRGTFPDYELVPTVRDVIDGKDAQLQFAFKILNN